MNEDKMRLDLIEATMTTVATTLAEYVILNKAGKADFATADATLKRCTEGLLVMQSVTEMPLSEVEALHKAYNDVRTGKSTIEEAYQRVADECECDCIECNSRKASAYN